MMRQLYCRAACLTRGLRLLVCNRIYHQDWWSVAFSFPLTRDPRRRETQSRTSAAALIAYAGTIFQAIVVAFTVEMVAIAPAEALRKVIALRVHLDDSSADNGPLRVLPGTHRLGRLPDDRIAALAREIDPVECTVSSGGVIAMSPLLVHASSKSASAAPRRVIHLEYACETTLGDGIELDVA